MIHLVGLELDVEAALNVFSVVHAGSWAWPLSLVGDVSTSHEVIAGDISVSDEAIGADRLVYRDRKLIFSFNSSSVGMLYPPWEKIAIFLSLTKHWHP